MKVRKGLIGGREEGEGPQLGGGLLNGLGACDSLPRKMKPLPSLGKGVP